MVDTLRKEVSRLETSLQLRLGTRVQDFQLVMKDGGLVLRGRAPSYYAKQLAQEAVMGAHSLPLIANEIQVVQRTVLPGGLHSS